jgi:hypothetical protein
MWSDSPAARKYRDQYEELGRQIDLLRECQSPLVAEDIEILKGEQETFRQLWQYELYPYWFYGK